MKKKIPMRLIGCRERNLNGITGNDQKQRREILVTPLERKMAGRICCPNMAISQARKARSLN